MKYMTGNEIRKAYLQFFKSKEHLILHSFPLIPENDPSLLLIGAGMAPLKPYFTGKLVPPSYRVTTSQKCIRTDDIDNVGRTARHHTFFEMLGNFSFGNYFKKEAISWAWEFLTKVLELDTDKLYVTIYPDDKEAYDYWHNMIGLADERIFKFDDNFWEIGEGPCGPDSEIFYDLGPGLWQTDMHCRLRLRPLSGNLESRLYPVQPHQRRQVRTAGQEEHRYGLRPGTTGFGHPAERIEL